ncbi:hypothetical protein L208DRAFT_1377618 [Tricholoma matsutake]|nr:hypothetical protein L208DRAFT_1377618 [Tricholoma matsutake 945]
MALLSWVTSDQQAFLTAQILDYLTAQKDKSLTSFWARLYEGWFQKFPELPQVMPGKSLDALSDNEKELLGNAIRVRQKNGNQARSHSSTSKSGTLKHILQTGTRAPQKAQVYSKPMYQDKIKAKVDAMISESGTMSQHKKFNLRMKITKEMWENEDEEVKAMVNEEVTKLTNLKLADGQGERMPEEMAEYGNPAATKYYWPFLSVLLEATGWVFTLLLGGLDPHDAKGDINIASYHAGETVLGNQFPAAHGDFEQAFVAPFTNFLINLYPEATHQKQSLEYARHCKEEGVEATTVQSENKGVECDVVDKGTSTLSVKTLLVSHITAVPSDNGSCVPAAPSVPSPSSIQVQALVPSTLSPLDYTVTPAVSSVAATPISSATTTSYAPAASPTDISAASVAPNTGGPNLGGVALMMWHSDSGNSFDFTACDFGASSVSANITGLPGMAPSAQHSFLDMLNLWDVRMSTVSDVDMLTVLGLPAIPFTSFSMSLSDSTPLHSEPLLFPPAASSAPLLLPKHATFSMPDNYRQFGFPTLASTLTSFHTQQLLPTHIAPVNVPCSSYSSSNMPVLHEHVHILTPAEVPSTLQTTVLPGAVAIPPSCTPADSDLMRTSPMLALLSTPQSDAPRSDHSSAKPNSAAPISHRSAHAVILSTRAEKMNQIGSMTIVGKENQVAHITTNSCPAWLTAAHAHLTTRDLGAE